MMITCTVSLMSQIIFQKSEMVSGRGGGGPLGESVDAFVIINNTCCICACTCACRSIKHFVTYKYACCACMYTLCARVNVCNPTLRFSP